MTGPFNKGDAIVKNSIVLFNVVPNISIWWRPAFMLTEDSIPLRQPQSDCYWSHKRHLGKTT